MSLSRSNVNRFSCCFSTVCEILVTLAGSTIRSLLVQIYLEACCSLMWGSSGVAKLHGGKVALKTCFRFHTRTAERFLPTAPSSCINAFKPLRRTSGSSVGPQARLKLDCSRLSSFSRRFLISDSAVQFGRECSKVQRMGFAGLAAKGTFASFLCFRGMIM